MDPREMENLIQRLVANPHDEEALAYAHQAGTTDPRSYALMLEKVGAQTPDPAYAAHWLSEAANVWSTTIGDAHHAARTLMIAIDKDPTQRTAADRLAELYREKGDQKALVALLERLVKSLSSLLPEQPEVAEQLVGLHEELGRLWSEPPLSRPERALENWRRLIELDPQNAYAIYAARELLKAQQHWAEALQYFSLEQALVDDPERKLALYRDEADIRTRAGDGPGATQALRNARGVAPDDAALSQEFGVSILDRVDQGEPVAQSERDECAQLFVQLAEAYDGDYGLSYSLSALRIAPGNDRAMQLADHHAKLLGRSGELRQQYAAYVSANPNGFMAADARAKAGSARPPPPAHPVSSPSFQGPGYGAPPIGQAAMGQQPPSSPQMSSGGLQGFGGSGAGIHDQDSIDADALVEDALQEVPPEVGDIAGMLAGAQSLAQKGQRNEALGRFREVLAIDPANTEALSWVEEHLRQKRMYADLRDVLLAATRVPSLSSDTRKAQLRDIAGLCESQLRDLDTAIQAFKQICQIDRNDDQAREQLRRLLERGARWDDLATVLEQEAMSAPDVEMKIGLEKKLAQLQEQKRRDPAAAADAWYRIAGLSPDDDQAILTAVRLYEKAEQPDSAARVIADHVSSISDAKGRGALLQKLGELRGKMGDHGGAGDALAEAADALQQAKLWEQAEKAYMSADRLGDAANAIEKRAELVEGKAQATLLAQAAELNLASSDPLGAIDKLERAVEIDPKNDAYAEKLEEQYRAQQREEDLVRLLLARAEKLEDKARRIATRKSAADVQRMLGDADGARASLQLVLDDGEDVDALNQLVEDAAVNGEHATCADLLRRLGALTKKSEDRIAIALREASIYAEELRDPDGAIERYTAIFESMDSKNRIALAAVADLEEQRGNLEGAATALEREIELAEGGERVEIAQRLAQMYEGPLANPEAAIKALDIVHGADPQDFDAIARLQRLTEQVGQWDRVTGFMQLLLDVEGDEDEASSMSRRLAEIYANKLEKGDEALSVLEKQADEGDEPCRQAYVELGDRLGWKGVVATKIVAWNESVTGPERGEALRSAFDRFTEIGRTEDAIRVAMELARSRMADSELGEKLEQLATEAKDLDGVSVAHDILAADLTGPSRATELVRQAEVLVAAGADPIEAMQHGESALTSMPANEVEPLLTRLAKLTEAPGHVIDLYERQVGRCRMPADRLGALARAAQAAAERGANDRARSFFELALSGGVQEETLVALEQAAKSGDEQSGSTALRSILAEALAAGGQGSRDGGRTRGALLRRAAHLAYRDLGDIDRAFGWLGDALITHVDDASLDAISVLGADVGDMFRVEQTLGRALEEVFDGPLVRKLLARRARLRREALGDRKGASFDLKKLHDLSPSDQEVMNELSELLQELGDHRGMIQLYEDQILRGRDPSQRAELARKVARIWEEELGDARETADAWRRVLRMKAADEEATEGLERAKSGNLKLKPPPGPGASISAYPPPSGPPSARSRPTSPPPADESTSSASDIDAPVTESPATEPPAEESKPSVDLPADDVDSTADQPPVGLSESNDPTPLPYDGGGAYDADLDDEAAAVVDAHELVSDDELEGGATDPPPAPHAPDIVAPEHLVAPPAMPNPEAVPDGGEWLGDTGAQPVPPAEASTSEDDAEPISVDPLSDDSIELVSVDEVSNASHGLVGESSSTSGVLHVPGPAGDEVSGVVDQPQYPAEPAYVGEQYPGQEPQPVDPQYANPQYPGQEQYPQGQYPSQEQYPQGHYPGQEQYPQGQYPGQEQYPQGQYPGQEGQYPGQEQYPQGQYPSQEQHPQGQYPGQEQYPQGQYPGHEQQPPGQPGYPADPHEQGQYPAAGQYPGEVQGGYPQQAYEPAVDDVEMVEELDDAELIEDDDGQGPR